MSRLTEIRVLYEAKLNQIVPKPTFHPRDIEKVRSDRYLHRILEHCHNNVQAASDMLYNIMEWRKTNKINDISQDNVDLNILMDGLYYPHGRDIDSCLLLIINCKKYASKNYDFEAVKKVFIYWLERLEREEGGKKITLFFDLEDCSTYNMNLTKEMIHIIKRYYPNFINYILFFEMSLFLSSRVRMMMIILPGPDVARMRYINRNELNDFIAPEQALVRWGGYDNYKFAFVPEALQGTSAQSIDVDDNYSLGEMLKLKPPKVLTFENVGRKISAHLTITNMDDGIVAFKIRTTAPERYTVHPFQGTLSQRHSKNIEISLQPGFQLDSIEEDRFLIVSVNVPKLDMSPVELSQLFKTARSNMDEYMLRCMLKEQKVTVTKIEKDVIKTIIKNMNDDFQRNLDNIIQVNLCQVITLFLVVICIFLNLLILFSVNRPKPK